MIAQIFSFGGHANSPVRPRLPASRVRWSRVAGRAERQAPQRLAVPRQPRQRGLVAEADRTVQLMAHPEHDVGGLDAPPSAAPAHRRRACGSAGRDAPQRVLGQDVEAAALHLGVGELELHALERRTTSGRTACAGRRARRSAPPRGPACRAGSSTAAPVRARRPPPRLRRAGLSSSSVTKPGCASAQAGDRRCGCPSTVTAAQRVRARRAVPAGRAPPTTSSPSTSRSAGAASRSASG